MLVWYLLIALGTFVEGEFTVLAATIGVYRGVLSMNLLMITAFIGTFFGDWLCFELGRKKDPQIVLKWAFLEKRMAGVSAFLSRFSTLTIFVLRFQIAMRIVGNFALGRGTISRPRYLLLNGIAVGLWTLIIPRICMLFVNIMAGLWAQGMG